MKKKHKRKRKLIMALSIISFLIVSTLFAVTEIYLSCELNESPNSQTIRYFYREEKNSLDGVYLGSSAADRYWVPTVAYENEGICIYNMGTTCQPFVSMKYLLHEIVKEQSDLDVIIIEPRNIIRPSEWMAGEDYYFKRIADFIPYSANRKEMTDAFLDYNKAVGSDIDYSMRNYYLPMFRSDDDMEVTVSKENLQLLFSDAEAPIVKGYRIDDCSFRTKAFPQAKEYTEAEPLDPVRDALLDDLLEYCKGLDAEVIFVSSPYAYLSVNIENIKYVMDRCEEEGFVALNFNCDPLQSEVAMDYSHDYYDLKHVNLDGATKYTEFLTEFLTANYSLEDHRGDPDYDSWNDAVDKMEKLSEEYN